MSDGDRKMFSPIRRGDAITPEDKVVSVLSTYEAGATPGSLAMALVQAGLAIGTRLPLTKRVGELLESLEEAGRVERIPDGRYRAVRTR